MSEVGKHNHRAMQRSVPKVFSRMSCRLLFIRVLWILCCVFSLDTGTCFAGMPCYPGLAQSRGRCKSSLHASISHGVRALRGGLDDRPEQVRRVREGANDFLGQVLGEAMSMSRQRNKAASNSDFNRDDAGNLTLVSCPSSMPNFPCEQCYGTKMR
jgi:hypothetical protein